MASLSNINNSLTFSFDSNKKTSFFEDQKSEVYFRKPIMINNPSFYINTSEKISNYFIPTIVNEKTLLERETEKLQNEIKKIEVSKQLKALKIKDLRNVIERISEEDYSDRFMDHRRLFTLERKSKVTSLQGKVRYF